MPPTKPSRTTMSGCPARRRPGWRHGATTVTIGTTNRLPDGQVRAPAVPTPDHRVSPGTLRCVEKRSCPREFE
jgi:hypothetical protein